MARRTSALLIGAAGAVVAASLTPAAQASTGEAYGYGSEYFLSNTFGPVADVHYFFAGPYDAVFWGDWDGDGTDTLAARRDAVMRLRNSHGEGPMDEVYAYGRTFDQVLVGDWDGDGADTFAVRRGATYYLSNDHDGGSADVVVPYGRADDQVLVGDWDGDGVDTLAVRRGATYYLANSLRPGPADEVLTYGRQYDETYAADWDGDGTDSIGVRRESTYYIANELRPGPADRVVVYGRIYDSVLAGDWDGDGVDTLGVRRYETQEGFANRAVQAAAANDSYVLEGLAHPDVAAWMLYAFQEFYSVEGPYSIGACTRRFEVATCLVRAEDFPAAAIGAVELTSDAHGYMVTGYDIYADYTPTSLAPSPLVRALGQLPHPLDEDARGHDLA